MGVGGEQGEAVRRGDEDSLADDQVAVAVAVRGSAQVGTVRAHHQIVERLGVDQVGIGMMPAEIGLRLAMDHRSGRRAEPVLEDRLGIRPGHRMHGIETHAEAAREQRADRIEIEQPLHQLGIVGNRVDHLDGHRPEVVGADRGEVDIGRIQCLEPADRARVGVDRLGHLLRRRPAIADIVLDAEIAPGPPGLWLAERMIPPKAPCLRITQEAAGVERMPPRPTITRRSRWRWPS